MSRSARYLNFKTARILSEWENPLLPDFLVQMVLFLGEERFRRFSQYTTITSIFRTYAENKALKAKSLTHVEWRAIDCRADMSIIAAEMDVRALMLKKFPTKRGEKPRVAPLNHGTAPHYHVQITRLEAKRVAGQRSGGGS